MIANGLLPDRVRCSQLRALAALRELAVVHLSWNARVRFARVDMMGETKMRGFARIVRSGFHVN